MTIVERTNHLKDLINSGHCSADDIAEQITQACAEHYKDREAAWKSNIDLAIAEARAEEFAKGAIDQQRRCAKHCEQQRQEAFSDAIEKAAKVVEERMEQNEIAADLYALPENKLARKVQAWMFDVAERIRALKPGEK